MLVTEQNNLISLIKKARGNRTLREYAKDSDVNVSIISRIENGEYKPGRKVLQKLTSFEAKPQGGVTYQELLEVANNDEQYKKGLTAGMSVVGITPMALAGIPGITAALAALAGGFTMTKAQELLQEKEIKKSISDNDEVARYSQLNQEIHRFAATAIGIMYGKMAEQGIKFRPIAKDEADLLLYDTDVLLSIEENEISSWLVKFATFSREDRELDRLVMQSVTNMFEKLLFEKPDLSRKVSIVVGNDVLFEYLTQYKERNSYRGNLSVIQVDVDLVEIVREEYISYFELEEQEDKLLLDKKEDDENE